jgi:hypothetical protein
LPEGEGEHVLAGLLAESPVLRSKSKPKGFSLYLEQAKAKEAACLSSAT